MTTITGAAAVPRLPAWLGYAVAAGVTFLGLVALRAAGLHDGLLYPDGYQYLLMAQGIAEHLEPAVTLGQGGDVFTPNVDAALKPLFPALVALASVLGVSPADAARAITVLAGAAVPVLTGLLALRLGAGRVAAAVAALLCAVSPTLVYWSGYTGPDPLAQALALGAALTLLHRRPVVGGALAGLCMLTRIDYAIVALAAFAAAVAVRSLRREAIRSAASGVLVAVVIVGLVRPPMELPPAAAIVGSLVLAGLAAVLLLAAGRIGGLWAACIAVSVLAPLALLDGGAWSAVARQDWPLLLLALAGLALCLRARGTRSIALRIMALSLPLAALYWVKNPGLERYVAQLVPELALVAALGLGTLGRRATCRSDCCVRARHRRHRAVEPAGHRSRFVPGARPRARARTRRSTRDCRSRRVWVPPAGAAHPQAAARCRGPRAPGRRRARVRTRGARRRRAAPEDSRHHRLPPAGRHGRPPAGAAVPGSRRQSALELVRQDVDEAAGKSLQHRPRQLRLFFEQRREVIAANRETADIRQRSYSGNAVCLGNEQRQLTEELPRPELSVELAAPFHHYATFLDDEHAGARVVRHREHGYRRHFDLRRELCHATERLVREAREQRNVPQAIEVSHLCFISRSARQLLASRRLTSPVRGRLRFRR